MKRRGSHPGFYGYSSPPNYGSSGDEGFRSPRPQYQSSPRGHHHNQYPPPPGGHHPPYGGGHHSPHHHSPHHHHNHHQGAYQPIVSPIQHTPGDRPRGRHPSMPSPGLQTPNYRGGRGGRGRYHSGGHSPWNRDANPGGSDDISQYYHPSMVEDPWEKLTPIAVSQTPSGRST